jgi:hypothetical protein
MFCGNKERFAAVGKNESKGKPVDLVLQTPLGIYL